MALGDRINKIRKEKKISIDELCSRSGVPKGTLSKITAGITTNPTLDTVQAIAKALACTLDDLDDSPILRQINAEEFSHIKKYRLLNEDGQQRLNSTLDDLLQIDQYRKPAEKSLDEVIRELDKKEAHAMRIAAAGGDNKIILDPPSKEEIQKTLDELNK